jgi:hypothetical protein
MRDDCWIWGLPDMCRPCKLALASGEPDYSPARCYPSTTVDDIKDLPLRALIPRQLVGSRWRLDRVVQRGVDDLPEVINSDHLAIDEDALAEELIAGTEPAPPCSEVVPMSPPASNDAPAKVDEGGKDRIAEDAEDAEDGWQIIQRVLRMR